MQSRCSAPPNPLLAFGQTFAGEAQHPRSQCGFVRRRSREAGMLRVASAGGRAGERAVRRVRGDEEGFGMPGWRRVWFGRAVALLLVVPFLGLLPPSAPRAADAAGGLYTGW